jgi:hypothetical protein
LYLRAGTFPATSENAAGILEAWDIKAGLIYIDAAHEFPAAKYDFERYWRILAYLVG